MNTRKRNAFTVWLLTLALLALSALALVFLHPSATAASASTGSMIDYDLQNPDRRITLDVNGGQANAETTALGTDPSYRVRTISPSLLTTDGNGYTLRDESDLYHYADTYFTIAFPQKSSDGYYPTIIITAKKATEKPLRFAMLLKGNGGEKKVTVEVSITANSPRSTVSTFYVGSQLNESHTGDLPVNDDKNVPLPIVLTNYTKKEIDLRKYLVGRKLYPNRPATANHAVTNDEGAIKNSVTAYGGEFLAFNDLSSYTIDTSSVAIHNEIRGAEFYDTDLHSFVFSVDLTSTFVDGLDTRETNGKFWAEGEVFDTLGHYNTAYNGAFFELSVRLTQAGGSSVTVNIPVVFKPAESPKVLSSFRMERSLNAGSNVDSTSSNIGTVTSSVSGYKTVRVYPEYLCDFPSFDGEDMYFRVTPGGDDDTVFPHPSNKQVASVSVGTDENGKVYYEVTGNANGRADVTFTVYYDRWVNGVIDGTSQRHSIPVPVAFTVYGAYDVPLSIQGTKTHNYTIKSPEFSRLYDDGYQFVSATAVMLNGAENTFASVAYSNGVLSITPQNSVFDTSTVAVDITMVNMQGRRIVLQCPIQIDMKAGDLFSTWRLWQIILFWVGIGLGVVLLLLLIIWLFIRSIHKRKLDELETSAPTSAYIIKLNSTIAAAQAQQRLTTPGYAPGGQPQMLQLGAGPTATAAPDPNTLALGAMPQMSTPAYSTGSTVAPPPPQSAQNTYPNTTIAPTTDEIYIPLSDEELLNRIYEEKFEPRGMLRRTFDKSKDLQQRELEREKERIREDVRGGMSIEDACKSLKQRESEASGISQASAPAESAAPQVDPLIAALGFDPADPIIPDVKREEASEEQSDEEKKFREAEYNNMRLKAELAIIESRIEAIVAATGKTEAEVSDANALVEELAMSLRETEQKLDDKNTDLAVERRKSAKETLNKEIGELEEKLRTDKDVAAGKKAEIEANTALLARIKEVEAEYADKREATVALVAASDAEYQAARDEAEKAAALAEKARRKAELNAKLEVLNPMMLQVNTLDAEIKQITDAIAAATEEKNSRKTQVAALQNELLSTTDSAKINEISGHIKDLNKEISEIDRGATANTTLKSNKGIEMTSVRRKANEFIDKEAVELEDVIAAEDVIIGQIALDKMLADTEAEKTRCEQAVAHWQETCDTLTNNLDALVMEAAAGVADRVKDAETELATAQEKLAGTTSALEAATSDEEKISLAVRQASLQEDVTRLAAELESVRADGIKANLEFRMQSEAEIENAREELAHAKEDFERVTERFQEISTNVNPLDLIASGSGVISQDRKKIEAENLKKQLEEQKNAVEQARLQAQMAQQEAEKAVADAQRASQESRAEAERLAQEALEKAEAARAEAEQKVKEEAERVRLEAQEEIERAKQEAEEARKAAEEEAERVRKEAEEEAERARKEAEEEAERARKEAEEEAEKARKAAEEEAERARKEAEEEAEKARKAAEEEAERARKEAEEEAEKARKAAEEEAQRKARIDEKVAKRKAEIATLRGELKNVTDEEQGLALREKFYAIQLALDEDEKTSSELNDLLNKSMDDASHAAELSRYKKLANQKPRRIVKKVTERVNRVPKAGSRPGARPGARPAGARPARPGARPAGARPARPGARPAARPGARPGARPPARPGGTRRPPTGKTPPRK